MNTEPIAASTGGEAQHSSTRNTQGLGSSDANHDLRQYGRAMRTGNDTSCVAIEKKWGLFGYPPEVVSTVLSCVATGLDLDAAIDEATS